MTLLVVTWNIKISTLLFSIKCYWYRVIFWFYCRTNNSVWDLYEKNKWYDWPRITIINLAWTVIPALWFKSKDRDYGICKIYGKAGASIMQISCFFWSSKLWLSTPSEYYNLIPKWNTNCLFVILIVFGKMLLIARQTSLYYVEYNKKYIF